MKLATIADGSRDGRLVIVSRNLALALPIPDIAPTMQAALDSWSAVEPLLLERAAALEAGRATGWLEFSSQQVLAPLPRAWQWLDGSAFDSHGELMERVFKIEPVPKDRPLMYQGVSDTFYGPTQEVPFPNETDGIDFEGEFGVIVDETPLGVTPAEAADHIKLLVQINDWSLRALAPIEMRTGFGWVQAKPPCSMAPVAVTPDELGPAWRDGRVDLTLRVDYNGARFGAASGYPMSWSLPELVAHAARTRRLCAGTVVGTGTVSNADFRIVGSSCIAERRGIEIVDEGEARTPFMRFGDRVRMEARGHDGGPMFGAIDQKVVRA